MWKMSLGYSMLIICPATTPEKQWQGFTSFFKTGRRERISAKGMIWGCLKIEANSCISWEGHDKVTTNNHY